MLKKETNYTKLRKTESKSGNNTAAQQWAVFVFSGGRSEVAGSRRLMIRDCGKSQLTDTHDR